MGTDCSKCCICFCLKAIECPAFCRCPAPIRTCCDGCCECADCCDVEDEDMEAVLHDKPMPKSGEASFTYENGDTYHGHWKNGARHGKGELLKANGTRQKGYFENDEYMGEHPVKELEQMGPRETAED